MDEIPFSSAHPPVTIAANVVPIPWDFEDGYDTVCTKMPTDTAPIGEPRTLTLFPYGCAKLRMTELPKEKHLQ